MDPYRGDILALSNVRILVQSESLKGATYPMPYIFRRFFRGSYAPCCKVDFKPFILNAKGIGT